MSTREGTPRQATSDSLRETQDVTVRILDVEIPRAPRRLLERFRDASSTAGELPVQFLDSGDDQKRVEMLFRLPVNPLRCELRRALQVDDRPIAGHAGVKALVDEVS